MAERAVGGLGRGGRDESEQLREESSGKTIFVEVSGLLILSPVDQIPLQGHSRCPLLPESFVNVCVCG